MARSTKWTNYCLCKGGRWSRCSACHTPTAGQALVERTGKDYRGRTVKQFLCWRCTNSAEGAELFVKAFPNVLEAYKYGLWNRVRPKKELQPLLFDTAWGDYAVDDLIGRKASKWRANK